MNKPLNTRTTHRGQTLVSRTALALVLMTAVLAGCANVPVNTTYMHLQQPVGRFVLIGLPADTVDVNTSDPGNAVMQDATTGAFAAPVIALQVASVTGSAAVLTAAAPVLAPLMVIGALAGAAHGASEPDEIQQARADLAEETSRGLQQLSAQTEAECAIAEHLARRYGDRFGGALRPAEASSVSATGFEIQIRSVRGSVDRQGNLVLNGNMRIRVLVLPERRELKTLTVQYRTSVVGDARFSTTLHDELDNAWKRFAFNISELVDNSHSGGTNS